MTNHAKGSTYTPRKEITTDCPIDSSLQLHFLISFFNTASLKPVSLNFPAVEHGPVLFSLNWKLSVTKSMGCSLEPSCLVIDSTREKPLEVHLEQRRYLVTWPWSFKQENAVPLKSVWKRQARGSDSTSFCFMNTSKDAVSSFCRFVAVFLHCLYKDLQAQLFNHS